jgi:peptidoglycan hydrolase-like protein with peptidoglycan-binding domain
MGLRIAILVLLLPAAAAAGAGTPFTGIHPEAAYPDPRERPTPDPYSDFIGRVQERLHELGFDAGPVNGDFGSKTQAALAQFQLSVVLPASGQLDDPTLAALGVEREAQASAGATAR